MAAVASEQTTPRLQLKSYERQDAAMALYAEVAARVNAAMPPTLAAKIGPLQITPRLHDDVEHSAPQFRSGPVAELAGAELRFQHLYGIEHADYAEDLFEWIMELVQEFPEQARRAREYVAQARRTSTDTLERDQGCEPPIAVRTVGYVIGRERNMALYDVVIEFEMLGPDLTLVIERVRASSRDILKSVLAEAMVKHRDRVHLLSQYRANRQRGAIDETTLRVMDAAGLDLAFVLQHLSRRSELVFEFDDGAFQATIGWSEGVLKATLEKHGHFSLRGGTLRLGQVLPETLQMGLSGRRLGSLVDQPYLPGDAVINSAYVDHDGSAILDVTIPTKPIPSPLKAEGAAATS